jgi:hypothetical protein
MSADLMIRHRLTTRGRNVFSERDAHFLICYAVPNETLKKGEALVKMAGHP